uniref:Ovule protein n=1 Tax=Ascaris lumbricoides TaxID=6252 RepID=A0A0M3IXL2_ASCLU
MLLFTDISKNLYFLRSNKLFSPKFPYVYLKLQYFLHCASLYDHYYQCIVRCPLLGHCVDTFPLSLPPPSRSLPVFSAQCPCSHYFFMFESSARILKRALIRE